MSFYRPFTKNAYELFLRERIVHHTCSFRNTFIVKRKIPPPLTRLRAERPRILKAKHFIYETVEEVTENPPPDLQVVLTGFVDGIGDVGDVISVCAFYARDHLLLPQKAVYASPENVEKYSKLKQTREERPKFSSIHAGMMVRIFSKLVIPVFMNSESPWTLNRKHIHIAFRNEGFHVPEETIELPHTPIIGPDPVKEAGDLFINVTINNSECVPVRCRIFHLQPGMETVKLSEDLYLGMGEPILAEQKELLDSMPMPEIIDSPSSSVSLVEKYRIQYIK